jgi:hypothetical protein
VAARSKVCGSLVAGITGSNPAKGMCLYVVLSCVGRGLCDGLITCPEESYRVSNYLEPKDKVGRFVVYLTTLFR